ncbi:hypothetical protein ACQKE4_08820 [Halomonas sp. NPDC076908]|uniref:hypothetical protein n=1 Tax=Halomonas sp. NPDC076908 TaxID=3390567 RepID=UPI003D06F31F
MSDANEFGVLNEKIVQLEAWTVKQAHQANRDWNENARQKYLPCGPVFQWTAWNEILPDFQKAYEQQPDSKILFKALSICLSRGLPAPAWCSKAFLKSWRKVENYETRTLDEAFAHSNKGINLRHAKRKRLLADKVTIDVILAIEDGASTENALREIAKEIGVSYELAREWYYDRRARFDFLGKSEKP